jgi:hypothetical protein
LQKHKKKCPWLTIAMCAGGARWLTPTPHTLPLADCIQQDCELWHQCAQPEMCAQCDYQPEELGAVCPSHDGYCSLKNI